MKLVSILPLAGLVLAMAAAPIQAHHSAPSMPPGHDQGGRSLPDPEPQGPPGHDKPGPPPIITRVTITTVTHPDMDDGGGDAEVCLSISIEHLGHGAVYPTIVEPDLNYDVTGGTWVLNRELYAHRECTPMESITITVSGIEADATNLDELESALLDVVTRLISLADARIDAGLLSRIIAGLFAALNPDDTLGSGTVTATGPGTYSVTTSGGDYSITAYFDVTTEVVEGNECDPDSLPPEEPPPGICYIGSAFYDSLICILPETDSLLIEMGNPGDVTPSDLDDARMSLKSGIAGAGQWVAIDRIEKAWGFEGAQQALWDYQFGVYEGASASALYWFRSAFCQAHAAQVNALPDPAAPAMPHQTAAVPAFIATRIGRTASYLIGVFGHGSGAVQVTGITGGPPGATFTLEPADPEHPSWQILHVAQNGPPGTYNVHVSFDSPELDPVALLLDIDETGTSGVDDGLESAPPRAFALHAVHPNPVRGAAAVRVDLPRASRLTVTLYDIAGRKVTDLVRDEVHAAGTHRLDIDGRRLQSGVYYVSMVARPVDGVAGRFTATEKIVVTR